MPIPALLLPFLYQGARREKQPGMRKHFFNQPGLLHVIPGPTSVTSDPCSSVHQALYPHYYSPVHLAGASQSSIPSDCHLRPTLGSTPFTPPFPRALPSSVLPAHHTRDCPHTGLFPLWHVPITCTSLPLPAALPAQPPEMVLPGPPLHLHLPPWQERGRRRQAKPLPVEWVCLIWCLFSVPSAQSLLNGVHL